MKKVVFLFVVTALLISCGSSKMARQAQHTFKGDWTLTDISYPGSSGFVDVILFQDVGTKCFVNSDWHFVSNNNSGTYQLYKSDCSPGKRSFRWNVQENAENGKFYFTLKPSDSGKQARKTKSGFQLELVTLNDTQMVWEETVSYQGKPFVVRMNFSKN